MTLKEILLSVSLVTLALAPEVYAGRPEAKRINLHSKKEPPVASLIYSTDKKEEQSISDKVAEKDLTPSNKALNVNWSEFKDDEYVGDIAYQKLFGEKGLNAQGEADYNYMEDKYTTRKFKKSYSRLKIDSEKGKEYLKFIEIDFEHDMAYAARQRKITKILAEGPKIMERLEGMGRGYIADTKKTYEEIKEDEARGYEHIREIEARNRKTKEETALWEEKGKTANERLKYIEIIIEAKKAREKKIKEHNEYIDRVLEVIKRVN